MEVNPALRDVEPVLVEPGAVVARPAHHTHDGAVEVLHLQLAVGGMLRRFAVGELQALEPVEVLAHERPGRLAGRGIGKPVSVRQRAAAREQQDPAEGTKRGHASLPQIQGWFAHATQLSNVPCALGFQAASSGAGPISRSALAAVALSPAMQALYVRTFLFQALG